MVFESTLVSIVLDEPLWFGFEIILSVNQDKPTTDIS